MATEPQHSEIMSGAAASSEPADVGVNAALILAALGRIEAVVRDERAALASLRASLGEMAQAIARAKAVADSENAAAMLDEFEHRVDAMIEVAGGVPEAGPRAAEPVTEPAAESDQVPTVSSVVLRLGPGDAAPEPATADASLPADHTAADKGPTVAMLTAMVEALSASIQTQQPEAGEAARASQIVEATPPAVATAPESAAAPRAAEVPASAIPEAHSSAEAASLPGETLDQETTLLASFEQMEIRPFPPPEVGTAVIFTHNTEPEQHSQAAHGFAAPAPSESPPASEPAPPATAEMAPQPPAPPAAADEPVPEIASTPDAMATAAEPDAAAPPPEAPAESKPEEPDFDPAVFLFGPEPEPDPAAFLLDPPPLPRTPKAILPQPEFVAMPFVPQPAEEQKTAELNAEPPQAEALQAAIAETDRPAQPTPEPAPHDPLHALKAMSANEKLAIFS